MALQLRIGGQAAAWVWARRGRGRGDSDRRIRVGIRPLRLGGRLQNVKTSGEAITLDILQHADSGCSSPERRRVKPPRLRYPVQQKVELIYRPSQFRTAFSI